MLITRTIGQRLLQAQRIRLITVANMTSGAPKVFLTPSSSLEGKVSYTRDKTRPVNAFLGVPYADPPGRFQPPGTLKLWEGVREAKRYGPICPQDTRFLENSSMPTKFPSNRSEDCLFLNVWTPTVEPSARLPVMLFIHGGAFVSGLGNLYQGTSLCTYHDVVVISINYRLGPFGFLCTGDEAASGNYGLMDMIESLRWVQKYITAFGGDKDNVTIFGESAGGISVSALILTPLARGLFHRAISESGTAAMTGLFASKEKAGKGLRKALKGKGLEFSTSHELVETLRKQPTEWLVRTLGDSMSAMTGGGAMTPVVDGHVIPEDPMQLYSKGLYNRVPYILGINSHEGAMFTIPVMRLLGINLETKDDVLGYLDNVTGRLVQTGSKETCKMEIFEEYFAHHIEAGEEGIMEGLVDFQGDLMFTAATGKVADAHSDSSPTFTYLLDHRPAFSPYPDYVKADHITDIFYIFGVPFANIDFLTFSDKDKQLCKLWMNYFVNFAKTGDPNSSDVPRWKSYSKTDRSTLNMNPDPFMMPGLRPQRMKFWHRLLDVYRLPTSHVKAKY